MNKIEIITKLKSEKLVAVLRGESQEQIEKMVDAIIKGGINFIEITMTTPNAINIIQELTKKYEDNSNIIIGAGTVLNQKTAEEAINSGAKYVVSPHLNIDIIKMCNKYETIAIPGVMTPTEIVQALEMDVDILKLFPSNVFGPKIIKAFRGPFPQVNFMPTGGISIENVSEWLDVGAVALGIGSNLTAFAKTNDYDLITKTASEFVNAVKNFETK